ncbi:hypothetical protein BDP27DRAFT_1371998 [Rhodocollybia butyracea]|uniref:Uncharacterized protein n=1 Tax=Rhodocollybia butyracea TaxID=206335 RepID=A0A9P5TXN4_9AGAR|nr:hypothetical protein BDP27DRAFT_1371998 [Rhodocollybia butyracea]
MAVIATLEHQFVPVYSHSLIDWNELTYILSFSFSTNPPPVGVNKSYEILWNYSKGEAPNDSFAIEVHGEDGYLKSFGLFNSSGSTAASGPPISGYFFLPYKTEYMLGVYPNVSDSVAFFTEMFAVQDAIQDAASDLISFSSVRTASDDTISSAIRTTSSATEVSVASFAVTAADRTTSSSTWTSDETKSSSTQVPLSETTQSSTYAPTTDPFSPGRYHDRQLKTGLLPILPDENDMEMRIAHGSAPPSYITEEGKEVEYPPSSISVSLSI